MSFSWNENKYKAGSLRDPWLIQRCKSGDFNSHMKTSEYLKFDYMGAAEFEYGALPEWQREMHSKFDKLVTRIVQHGDQKLYVMAEPNQIDQYGEIMQRLVEGKVQTKLGVRLTQKETIYVGKNMKAMFDQPHAPFEFDCWWDITNGLVFARSEDILSKLRITVENSVKFMNNKKADKR